MSIEAICRCGKVLRAKDELAGKRVRCPQCQQAVLIQAAPELVDDVDVVWDTNDVTAMPNPAEPAYAPLYPDLDPPMGLGNQPMTSQFAAYHQPSQKRITQRTVGTVAIVGSVITALVVIGFMAAVLLRPGVEVASDVETARNPTQQGNPSAVSPLPSPAQYDELSHPPPRPAAAIPQAAQDNQAAADAMPVPGQAVAAASSAKAGSASPTGKWEDLGLAMNQRMKDSQALRGATKIGDEPVMARFSWMVQLLPHLGHSAIYEQFELSKSWSDKQNLETTQTIIPEFLNPADPRKQWSGYPFQGMALSHFVGVSGLEEARNDVAALLPRGDPRAGVFGYDEIARPEQITDGTSQTVMIIGSGELASPWVQGGGATIRGARQPYFGPISGFGSRGLKQPGAQASFADGSVRTLSKDISPKVFRSLVTIHGAETIDQQHLAEGSTFLDMKGQADDKNPSGRVEWQEHQ